MWRTSQIGLVGGLCAIGCMGSSPEVGSDEGMKAPPDPAKVCAELGLSLEPPHEVPTPDRAALRKPAGRKLVARWDDARIYIKPDSSSLVIGYGRGGEAVGVRRSATGSGCPSDEWYALDGGGYACATREFRGPTTVSTKARHITDAPLPYGYARVAREGALSRKALPLDGNDTEGQAMTGAYFITVVDTVEHEGHAYHRTAAGEYVRVDDTVQLDPPAYGGEVLAGASELPLAFVFVAEAELRCTCDGVSLPCGTAKRMTRFTPLGERTVDGQTFLQVDEQAWIDRAAVRLARPHPRPDEVPEGERWIHVDLSEQVVVAYEGDDPVFATLASTGKPGYETPTGTWRIQRKYVSTTMRGPDEQKGTYTVSEVPWTMFYDKAYALHGAYWHAEFGTVRSHGCTNLPPADARWLFVWAGGVPPGWHADAYSPGPWVHVTATP